MLLSEIERNQKIRPEKEQPLAKVNQTDHIQPVSEETPSRKWSFPRHQIIGRIVQKRSTEEHDEDWVTLGNKPGTIVRQGSDSDNPPLEGRIRAKWTLVVEVQNSQTDGKDFKVGDEVTISKILSQKQADETRASSAPSSQQGDYVLHLHHRPSESD